MLSALAFFERWIGTYILISFEETTYIRSRCMPTPHGSISQHQGVRQPDDFSLFFE